jgi:hypothetical protein
MIRGRERVGTKVPNWLNPTQSLINLYPISNGTYVKATGHLNVNQWEYFATDPTKTLTGDSTSNAWLSAAAGNTNQRFHIDCVVPVIVTGIYYENYHNSGGADRNLGAQHFTFQGSNIAASFADVTYADNAGWDNLPTTQNSLDQHIGLDQADPKFIGVINKTAYRYYAFKFADNWGGATYMGLRRIELQIGVFT